MNIEGTHTFDSPLDRIMKLMKDTFGSNFNAYYEGDPIDIPKANLPCIIMETQAGQTQLDATSTDRVQTQINIRIVFNKADDYSASDTQDLTEKKLRILVEGCNPDTGAYLPNSVVGVLRKNFTLGNGVIENDIDWQYDLQPRTEDLTTSEALVQIVTSRRVIVNNRE